jgi:hypothetical protein
MLEHKGFIAKDSWRIFDSKGLENFSLYSSQIFCLTGAVTVKLGTTLKGLSYEIDLKNVNKNWQILGLIRAAAGF